MLSGAAWIWRSVGIWEWAWAVGENEGEGAEGGVDEGVEEVDGDGLAPRTPTRQCQPVENCFRHPASSLSSRTVS